MRFPEKFDQVIGIDQSSRPRALPFMRMHKERGCWVLESGSLPSFRPDAFEACGIPVRSGGTWITADCVLWPLEGQGEVGMWQTFSAASRFEGKAAAFFRDRRGETDFREADRLAGAHSVFRELPYQRNIQSGTFRIWSELEGRRWLNLWPFCERAHPNQAWLAEGYPSLFWKRFLKQTKRNPPILAAWIRSHWDGGIKMGAGTRKALLDPDCADAAVLCLCSFDLLANNPGMLAKRRTLPRDEGWIFGLERP